MTDQHDPPGRGDALSSLLEQRPPWANRLILVGVCGSDAHGTKLPKALPFSVDDTDLFGICVQSQAWYLGLNGYYNSSRQHWDTNGEAYDHVVFDVRKFFALLSKGNPNVHSWLWTNSEDILLTDQAGKLILQNREIFLSKRCFAALAGYARSQLHKMDRKQYQGYQGEKRRQLVDLFGFDTKHAAHCIRLLNMGIELAETGRMSTRRQAAEAATLMDIKSGKWSLKQVEAEAERLWAAFRDAEKLSPLPDDPDTDKINDLLLQVLFQVHYSDT